MPIHNLGYRPWKQALTSSFWRWWSISSSGIALAQRSRWVRRILLVSWLPVIYMGAGFFIVGQALDGKYVTPGINRDQREVLQETAELLEEASGHEIRANLNQRAAGQVLRRQFSRVPNVDQVADALRSNDRSRAQNQVWCWLLMVFFRYPQGLLMLMLVGAIAPPLISRDIRSKAFLLYFSRPIGRWEYLLGKFFIPATFMVLVSTLPALALYIFAILMSPDLSVFWSTWDVPLRVLAGTLFLVVPTVLVALMLSSLTQETRFASFAWFAFWALGHGAWLAVALSTAIRIGGSPFSPAIMNHPEVKRWSLLSLYNNISDAQSWVFGFSNFGDVWSGITMLGIISIVSLVILFRQISSPLRV